MNLKVASIAMAAAVLALAGCSVGVDSYEDFQSSVSSGAPCGELFDQRSNFDDEATLEKIDGDLSDIGCEDRDSVRNDQ